MTAGVEGVHESLVLLDPCPLVDFGHEIFRRVEESRDFLRFLLDLRLDKIESVLGIHLELLEQLQLRREFGVCGQQIRVLLLDLSPDFVADLILLQILGALVCPALLTLRIRLHHRLDIEPVGKLSA